MKEKRVAEVQDFQHIDLRLNVEHRVDADGNLVISVPAVTFSGPLVDQDRREEILHKTGLTALEIDYMIDSWYEQLQSKSMIAWLLKQKV